LHSKQFVLMCNQLLERLPELLWSLPFWPKAYSNYLPRGLFQTKENWLPKDAIAEIESNIKLLSKMGEKEIQSEYLVAKILKQVQALVSISQHLIERSDLPIVKPGLTRPQQLQNLNQKKRELQGQYEALEKAKLFSKFHNEISLEQQKIDEQLHHIKKLIAQT
jgi:hypothetical protein